MAQVGPLIRVMIAVSSLEKWGSIFLQTKNMLTSAHNKSSEFPQSQVQCFPVTQLTAPLGPPAQDSGNIRKQLTWTWNAGYFFFFFWVMKYFVCDAAVSCLLPTSVKWWDVSLLAWELGNILDFLQFLTIASGVTFSKSVSGSLSLSSPFKMRNLNEITSQITSKSL